MSMIPDEIIEQVRDAADVVAIIGEGVDLKRTGSDWRGPCPFHGGTHRNFAVIPKKGRYYCFVCHESGDVFSYFMKRFGMDYPTAVRDVARRVGIVIPERIEKAGPDPKEPLYGAVAAAHDWFARQLRERADAGVARDYLADRGIDLETASQLGLGFAPTGGAFQEAMKTLGIAEAVLLEAGLLSKRDDGRVGPRFRGRLLFPIHDLRGRVVGFGGRILGPGEPKYLNSPETPIFHKGSQLYNLHQAKQAIRKEEAVLLVEGYFDVLRLVLAGVEHVVAPLGTALTSDQAALLKRYAPQAILLYDSDQAGLKATFRAGDELLRHGVRVRVASMPPGEDPDTLVRKGGAAALEGVLKDAVDLLERKIQLLERKGWLADIEHRRGALDRLLPTLRAASDPITQELYVTLVAEKIGVPREVVAREVSAPAKAGASPARRAPRAEAGPPRRAPAATKPFGADDEARILTVMALDAEWWDRALDALQPTDFQVPRYRELFGVLQSRRMPFPGQQIPEGLSELQQALWSKLLERTQRLAGQSVDDIYASAVEALQARPLFQTIDATRDIGEKRRLRDEARARFPNAFTRWFTWARAAQRARRDAAGDAPRDPA
ncbi:MAG TPA: DNA primase [Gemmatimonadales bacterium]|nr:DNA primase [Gemmatimonadales bacterium]